TVGVVPGTGATVTQFALGLVPSPQFDERVQPGRDMEGGDVGEVMSDLLLTQAVNFLQVVEVLLDGSTVGDRFENLGDRGVGVGAKIRDPAVGLTDQDD